MKTLGVLLLLVGTVFGQQISDISAANSPLHVSSSASVVSGANVASKEILLYVVALGQATGPTPTTTTSKLPASAGGARRS